MNFENKQVLSEEELTLSIFGTSKFPIRILLLRV